MISLSDSLPITHTDDLTFPDDYEWSDELGAWVEKDDLTKEAELAVILYYYLRQRRKAEQAAEGATRKLLEEKITAKKWHEEMIARLLPIYTLVSWLAMGDRPSEGGLTAINEEYQFHQEKLNDFLKDLGSMTEAQILRRSELYPEATIGMLHKLRHEAKIEAGYKFSRRFLSSAEHCPDCIRYAAMGKKPIGVLPPPGTKSACMFFCKCKIVYYKE